MDWGTGKTGGTGKTWGGLVGVDPGANAGYVIAAYAAVGIPNEHVFVLQRPVRLSAGPCSGVLGRLDRTSGICFQIGKERERLLEHAMGVSQSVAAQLCLLLCLALGPGHGHAKATERSGIHAEISPCGGGEFMSH